jgi:hypothetical protein
MTRTERLSNLFTTALLAGGLALAAVGIAAGVAQINVDTTTAAFDPQPEPPTRPGSLNPGERVGFNPQPDPPGVIRGFNPQPEPPTRIAVGR